MIITIIDDGIDISLNREIDIVYDMVIELDGLVRERAKEEAILTYHGTTCAAIIRKYAPKARFCSLRIFDEVKLRTDYRKLTSALEWCYERRIPIVHLSVGTSHLSDYGEIRKIVSKMLASKQIIIAAHSNTDMYTMPASIAGVFGVIADEKMSEATYDIFEYENVCDVSRSDTHHSYLIKASSKHKVDFDAGVLSCTPVTNSYATPTVTSAVFNIISQWDPFSLSVPQVFALLGKARRQAYFRKPDFIAKANLFNPYGHVILKNHLFFDYDREFDDLICIENMDSVFLPASESSENVKVLDFISKHEDKMRSIIYCGELHLQEWMKSRNGFFWSESDIRYDYNCENQTERYIKVPIVNINGDPLQTVDLLCFLRNLFLEKGYQCIGVSNTMFSYLYGLEYIGQREHLIGELVKMETLYKPDLIIMNFNELETAIIDESCCFNIYIIDSIASGVAEESNHDVISNRLEVLAGEMKYSYRNIYEVIVRYFE